MESRAKTLVINNNNSTHLTKINDDDDNKNVWVRKNYSAKSQKYKNLENFVRW